ncbi:MAG: ABC transporter ATP-binding protein [Oscillospiraceae bacterium]|jgi:putative ABC transport system ATP-binding protein|nr:ABC transporter ATP-binding protein [Oscillospiraceae bacterium]
MNTSVLKEIDANELAPEKAKANVLTLKGINKKFRDKEIFKDFNLEISERDFVAITGESGAGKTTLLNMMGLIEEPDSGILEFSGERAGRPNSQKASRIIRYNIGYLFQNFALLENDTVKKNLLIGLKYVKVSSKEKDYMIKKALGEVGLADFENRKIYELSGGEQQRVAIARVMLKPSIIILADEPTGSLDEDNKKVVVSLLKDLNKTKAIVIVTHDPNVANEASRIIEI